MTYPIDLRSDTVSRPTERMRRAMAEAEVGDDVLRDDPTVLRLENRAAELLEMEAAMFTVSGTMSNEIALAVFCRPSDQVIVQADSHILTLEAGAMSAIAGAQPCVVPDQAGCYDLDALRKVLAADIFQAPRFSVLCLENSFHLNRGLALAYEDYGQAISIAHEAGLKVMMDGARIFNSAAALQVEVASLVRNCDAVSFCLCKGLAAPVGAILAGSRAFIDEARRVKQRLGGGWRQAGVLAAAGLVGLDEMQDRLVKDHANAETFRQGVASLGLQVDRGGIMSNIVRVDLAPIDLGAAELAAALAVRDIRVKVCDPSTIRIVTHHDITPEHVQTVLAAIDELIHH